MNLFKRLFGSRQEKPVESAPTSEEIEKAYADAMTVLQEFKRTAYIPETVESQPAFSAESKIGGLPYLRDENDWPICPNCKRHMQLFLQLDLTKLPERKDNGLLQLFYCTSYEPMCEIDMQAFFAFSKSVESRIIEADGESAIVQPNIQQVFDEKKIVDWTAKDDYPHFEEYDELGIELELDDDVFELMEERNEGHPVERDKLFGWPYWIQASEYPFDRKTESKMELFFQLASEDNLSYMFGDAGIGHLTQSPDNRDELGFGWACS